MTVSDLSEKIVRLSERVRLPSASDGARPEDVRHDKLLVSEVLELRASLLEDLDCDLTAAAFRRAVNSLVEIDAKAYFTDMKVLRSLSISPSFRCAVVGDPNAAFKQLRRAVRYKWTVTSFPHMWDPEHVVNSYGKWIQWVSFDSRLNLRSADYSQELFAEYCDDELRMKGWDYPTETVAEMHAVIREWSESYPTLLEFVGSLPSGATVELKRRENCPVTAISTLVNAPRIDRYLETMHGYESNYSWPLWDPVWVNEIDPMRIDFVPKTPLTNRMISVDTASMLLIQKDLDRRLRSWLKGLPVHCDLRDQEKSRQMALSGSRFGEYDTFDLSKCSDSVTTTLVSALYADTYWLVPLLCSRNPRARYGETVLELEKFAPMGSSTCFPIETSVILAACEVAVRRTKGRKGKPKDYRVYGDDAVIRHDCGVELAKILSDIHLTVNVDKTFTDVSALTFREACGMEAVNGVDITPVRLSRFQPSTLYTLTDVERPAKTCRSMGYLPRSTNGVVSVIEFSNRLQLAGLRATRKTLLSWFPREPWFYKINRVDESDYRRAMAPGSAEVVTMPMPSFVVPDGTATNYRMALGHKSNYDKKSSYRPKPRLALTVKVRASSRSGTEAWLDSQFGTTKSVDELAYHYWSLAKSSEDGLAKLDSQGRSHADSVGVVERLRYFGNGLSSGPDGSPSDYRLETTPLEWDWKELYLW